MKRVVMRKKKGLACASVVMPRTLYKMNEISHDARRCRILTEMDHVYEVEDLTFKFIVNLQKMSCDCRRWDVSGIPCRHAWLAIQSRREDPLNYLSFNHTKAAFQLAYDIHLNPLPSKHFWPDDLTNAPCDPPDVKRKAGRPAVQRVRHPSEAPRSSTNPKRSIFKCGNCGESGHTKRKCSQVSNIFSFLCNVFLSW